MLQVAPLVAAAQALEVRYTFLILLTGCFINSGQGRDVPDEPWEGENKMQKLKKSPVSIACYIIAALVLIYCFYLLGTSYKTIADYYSAYSMKPQFGEVATYILQSCLTPFVSAVTLFMAAFILDSVRKLDPKNYVEVKAPAAIADGTAVAFEGAEADAADEAEITAAETMPEYEDGVVEFGEADNAAAETEADGAEIAAGDSAEFTEFVEASAAEADEDMKVDGETAEFSKLAEDLAGDYTDKAEESTEVSSEDAAEEEPTVAIEEAAEAPAEEQTEQAAEAPAEQTEEAPKPKKKRRRKSNKKDGASSGQDKAQADKEQADKEDSAAKEETAAE